MTHELPPEFHEATENGWGKMFDRLVEVLEAGAVSVQEPIGADKERRSGQARWREGRWRNDVSVAGLSPQIAAQQPVAAAGALRRRMLGVINAR